MILILADSTDPWAMAVHRTLRARGETLSLVSPAQVLAQAPMNFPVTAPSTLTHGTVMLNGVPVPLTDLSGVFVRIPFPIPLALDDVTPQDQDYVTKETTATWLALLNALSCRVVNRPVPGGCPTLVAAEPTLTALAQRHGALLPLLWSTTDAEEALRAFRAWGGRAYVKPLGQAEPGLLLCGETGTARIREWMVTAALSLQHLPAGQPLSVFVVGGAAVATIVRETDHLPQTECPSYVSSTMIARCVGLVQAMGLDFAECSVVVDSNDTLWCLDISGSPNYWGCPLDVQRQVVDRLAVYLSEERSLPIHDSITGADRGSRAR